MSWRRFSVLLGGLSSESRLVQKLSDTDRQEDVEYIEDDQEAEHFFQQWG